MNGSLDVLVLNGQNWLGLSRLPALLHKARCRVTVFGPPGGVIEESRYVYDVVRAPREPAAQVARLREFLATYRGRFAWTVVGDDPTLVELARHRHEPWVRDVYPVDPRSPALGYISSKAAFADAAPTFGVPTPESRVCSTVDDALLAAAEVGYPVMLKTDVGMAGDGVRRADNAAQLLGAFADFRARVPLVVQKFVPGRVGVTEILFDRGRPAAYFNSYKRECHPDNGPSCVREICDYPDCERVLTNLGRMTGFHGLCGIDWIQDAATGRFYVLELNPRPTSAYHVDRHAGVNFARALHHFVRNREHTERPRPTPSKRPIVYLFPQHVVACVGQHRRKDLLKWLPLAARHDVPWRDPAVLRWHLRKLTPLLADSLFGSVRRKLAKARRAMHVGQGPRPTPA